MGKSIGKCTVVHKVVMMVLMTMIEMMMMVLPLNDKMIYPLKTDDHQSLEVKFS